MEIKNIYGTVIESRGTSIVLCSCGRKWVDAKGNLTCTCGKKLIEMVAYNGNNIIIDGKGNRVYGFVNSMILDDSEGENE